MPGQPRLPMPKDTDNQPPHLPQDHALLKSLMRALPDLVWLKDTHGRYLACNRIFEEFFGATEAEIIGKTDYDFVDATLADFFREHDLAAMNQGLPTRNEEWITFASDDHRVLVETTKTPMYDEQGNVIGVLGMAHDITELKSAEKQLIETSLRYEAVMSGTIDGFWAVNTEGIVQDVNQAYCKLSGYSREELIGKHVSELDTHDQPDSVRKRIQDIMKSGGAIFESEHQRKDGSIWPVEISISYSPIEGGRFFSFFRDISQRRLEQAYTSLRQKLSDMVYSGETKQLMQTALDRAEQLTGSEIGFFHFVDEDQENVSLQVWSTRTLHEMCFAEGDGMHYPVSQAGVWVDCIHQQRPVIHNDYASLTHKKGLPEGHAPLLRELTMPVYREGRIVAIMGVGNKRTEYNDTDLDLVGRIADMTFDFVERKQSEQQIHFMAYNDILTGLPNRELFADRLQQAIYHAHRFGKLLGICYLDLDGFKPVNDQHGHEAGDQLLIELAKRLLREMREIDTIARLGGDEFVILFNDLSTIFQGEEIVERLLKVISEPFSISDNTVYVSASAGLTFFPHDNADADTLLRHADQAMYQAKESGKNKFRLFDPIAARKSQEYRQSLHEFEKALNNNELLLYYQPRIELQTGRATAVEALIRWLHPEKGLLTPNKFLPVIENTALEIALDEWVLKNAMDQHMQWRSQGLHLPVSINISPRHIQQKSFTQQLAAMLASYPDDLAANIELEVLETSAINDINTVSEIMNDCTALGVRFSLDDFGTGYSSLTHFHRLPISVLKIDQHFVRDMLENSQDQDIVEGVVRLAQTLKTPVVAEGVETVELGMILLQLGCQYAQGFGIARPMSADNIVSWLAEFQDNSIWYELHSKAADYTPLYDLNIAIFSHHDWLEKIHDYLQSGLTGEAPAIDDKSCQFSRWYHGMGQNRFGHKPGYAFIIAIHNKLHDQASRLIEIAREYGTDKALEEFAQLQSLSDELTQSLLKLAD